MTTKLDQILSVLKENPNLVIAKFQKREPCREGISGFECVEIWVAPKTGLYNLWELNPFLNGLTPGIIPTSTTLFATHEGTMYFGRQSFREQLTPAYALAGPSIRYITLRVFPTNQIAQDILEGRLVERDLLSLETRLSEGTIKKRVLARAYSK